MAHRIIAQVFITGGRVFGRAFSEAYKQASSSQQQAAQAAASGGSAANNLTAHGLTIDEACKILNVPPPKQGVSDMANVVPRFKKLFDQNNPDKGGSHYLQSKILRARERLELEVQQAEEKAARDKEMKDGWNPKLYRD